MQRELEYECVRPTTPDAQIMRVSQEMCLKKAQDVAGRIVALFLTNALGVITGASVIAPELEIWKAAALAGAVSVFKVVESLARASVDGKLTADEIDAAFGATPAKIAAKKAVKKVTK